jgi:FkbM family methyltransferase
MIFYRRWNKGSSRIASQNFYPQQPSCQIPYLYSLFELFLGKRNDGIFVEVGANDGVSFSNTWGLAEQGWRGYLIEPIPEFADSCRRNHKNHASVSVFQYAIGNLDNKNLVFNIAGALTTANSALRTEYESVDWALSSLTNKEITVPSKRLDTFLTENGLGHDFDVLVVDVEGFEAEVFSGFELVEWRPKMIIVELVDTHPDLKSTATSDAQLGERILLSGYRIVSKDVINTVFVREDIWKIVYEVD